MADPLSVTASVLGVTTAALQSVQYLVNTIDNVKSVPEAISNVKSDLQAVQPVLKQLEQSEQSGGKTLLTDEIKPAVQNCGRACDAFQKQLDHWMRHSSADKTFWADRFRVGLFGQERTQALRAQLNDCKATLSVAMSTATYVAQAKAQMDQDDKADILEPQEATMKRKIERAGRDQVQVQNQLQQLSVTINNQIMNNAADQDAVESQRELLKEIQEQLQSKEAMKKAFEEAMAEMKGERTGMKIRGVKGTQKGQAVAGIVGGPADSYRGTMDISDVSAADESIAAAGVIQNYEFKHY